MKKLVAVLLLWPAWAVAEEVTVATAGELIAAIESGATQVVVSGDIAFDQAYQGSAQALPVIQQPGVSLRGASSGASLRATVPGFRLLNVAPQAQVQLEDLTVSDFHSEGPGGAIFLAEYARMTADGVVFADNSSQDRGGAIATERRVEISASAVEFLSNESARSGGALSLIGTSAHFSQVLLRQNVATIGCAIAHPAYAIGGSSIIIENSLVDSQCSNAAFFVESARAFYEVSQSTLLNDSGPLFAALANESNRSRLTPAGSVLVSADASLCNGALVGESKGGNLLSDASCFDALESDAQIDSIDEAFVRDGKYWELLPSGPAIDRRPAFIDLGQLPLYGWRWSCGQFDLRGDVRAIDGDGDAMYACDSGHLELQHEAPVIDAAVSGAYYDPGRPGEGFFIELLDAERAWVSMFSYIPNYHSDISPPQPQPRAPMWLTGIAEVEANTLRWTNPLQLSSYGAGFGEHFDPNLVNLEASEYEATLIFDDCSATLAGGANFGEFQTQLARLTQLVDCDREPSNPRAGLSGNFYDPARNGEGIAVHWHGPDRVSVIWYTLKAGQQLGAWRQLWLVSDSVSVSGNQLVAEMVWPAEQTFFAEDFDPADISMEPWGTVTIDYTSCDSMQFSYDSQIEGYGSGSYDYVRLTQPAGTSCDSLPE